MSEEITDYIIKETQNALSKFFKKPPLTEKLLKKPPFRYLHDIVTAVIKNTGFLDGLFSANELNSNNIKDKESKIAFLDKLITAVKKATGENITVRSAKIVAGLEVPKTLELLQAIGRAIDKNIDSTQIIAEPSNIETKKSQTNKNNETKEKKSNDLVSDRAFKEPKKVLDKLLRDQKYSQSGYKEDTIAKKDHVEKSKITKKPLPSQNFSDSAKKQLKSVPIAEIKNKPTNKNSVKRDGASVPTRRVSLKDNNHNINNTAKAVKGDIKEEKKRTSDDATKVKMMAKNNEKTERQNSIEKTEIQLKNIVENAEENQPNTIPPINSEEIQEFSTDDKKHEKCSLKKRESTSLQRPGSARPGSRKPVNDDNQNKVVSDNAPTGNAETNAAEIKNQNRMPSSVRPKTANRPASARPGAPRIRDRGEVSAAEEPDVALAPVNVIEEGKQDHLVDKDNFIVIETEDSTSQLNEIIKVNESEQGQLVHQILKTQKELNQSIVADNTSQSKQFKIEWEAGLQREKDIVSEEIENIRCTIQKLTSAANPLGKLFDFLQEDVDEMQRELQHWKIINDKLHKQQLSELELGKSLLSPLQKQLSDIENNIEEEYMQIANIKISIMNNDEKILKLSTNNSKIRIK